MGPPLTANRTMGALGGLVAGRIAREHRIGGPSFTLSCGEASGLQALKTAVRLLQQGEIDEAVVGAVDLPCDPRATIAAHAPGRVPTDAAVALVVKRLDDALRAGDLITAIVVDCNDAAGPNACRFETPEEYCGAASGLATLVRAALCLYQQVLPDGPQHWLRDRADGPRRATVTAPGGGGEPVCVLLEEHESSVDLSEGPLGDCTPVLFAIESDDEAGIHAQARRTRSARGPRVHHDPRPPLVAGTFERPCPTARSRNRRRFRRYAPCPDC